MSKFSKLSYVILHFQCHTVWVSKYRYLVLTGQAVDKTTFESIDFKLDGISQRETGDPNFMVISLVEEIALLGNHFGAKGYYVDTEMIQT